MKNVQIGDNDLVGKRFNGFDLHLYLRETGIDSKHLVWLKQSDDPYTIEIAKYNRNKQNINDTIKKLSDQFSSHNFVFPFVYDIIYNKDFLQSDIVHYHLIHNFFFNLTFLPFMTKLKPSVWTLHDPWAFTGHCIHPLDCEKWKTGCGDCPDLQASFEIDLDTTALNWAMKKNIYDSSKIDIVVSSKWMHDRVNKSPLLSNFKKHLIHFGINLDIFKPGDSLFAKKKLGIPSDNIVIGFRAQTFKLKGLDYIKVALNQLNVSRPVTLLTFNQMGLMNEYHKNFQVIDLGWVMEDHKLVEAYNAVDIFIMPSLAESFGMMAMEAMACGKPVIVFDDTALAETVYAPHGGIALTKGDAELLKITLERLIEDHCERKKLGDNALNIAQKNYSHKSYVDKTVELYKEVVEKNKPDIRAKYIVNQLNSIEFDSYVKSKIKNNQVAKFEDLIFLLSLMAGNTYLNFILVKIVYPPLNLFYRCYSILFKKKRKL